MKIKEVGDVIVKVTGIVLRETLMTLSKRWRRFILILSIILLLSAAIPIIAMAYFYGAWVSSFKPILGEAWYLRISVGEPTEFTRIIERVIPFWRYPIFSIEFTDPYAPKFYYTYENLVMSLILGLVSATLVCLYSELISIKGRGVRMGLLSGQARKAGVMGILAAPLIQGGSVAYATIIGCSTCFGSLLVQISFAGFAVTITSTAAAYTGYIGFIVGVVAGLLMIIKYSRDLYRLSSVRKLRL